MISIIIPSAGNARQENVDKLLSDIARQKIATEIEICHIQGISPAGKARNRGAEKAKGDILIFIDDDIRLEGSDVIGRLVNPLLSEESIGATFSSLLIPPDSSRFQRRYAKEIPRSEIPVVGTQTDAGAMSTHLCAIRKELFFRIGKFNEDLKRGEDPEFSYRLKQAGYRLVLVAKTYCYHPVPKNIRELIMLHFRNGRCAVFADRNFPQLNIDVNPKGIIYPTRIQTKWYRITRFMSQFLAAVFSGKILLSLSKISYIFGFLYGLIKP
ncbi:MAG: glycosyltransferase [Candidatus Omnitrophota bacterium]